MRKDNLERFFNQYKKPNEEYQTPNYAFRFQHEEYHFGIYMIGGKGVGYAIFAENPIDEEMKLFILEQFAGVMSTFTRIKEEYDRKRGIDNRHLLEAKTIVGEWANTVDERDRAERFKSWVDLLVETHKLYMKEFEKLAAIQEGMFQKGYFTIEDKEHMYSVGAMMDLLPFLQIKKQLDEFNHNKALFDSLKKRRNKLSFFKYRKLKKVLSIYTREDIFQNLLQSKSTYGNQWDTKKIEMNDIHNKEIYQSLLNDYYERDRELVVQAKVLLRN